MFEKIYKMIFATSNLPKVEVDVEKPPSLSECKVSLINKFLRDDEIVYIMNNESDMYKSDKIISYNEKEYVVVIERIARYCFNNILDNTLDIRINEVGSGNNACLDDVETCKFIIDNMEEVKESLKNISDAISKKVNDMRDEAECAEKCIKKLHLMIKDINDA